MQVPFTGETHDGFSLPFGYSILYEDHNLLTGSAFSIPGVGPSWCRTTPPLRLLVRDDVFVNVRHNKQSRVHRADVLMPQKLAHHYQHGYGTGMSHPHAMMEGSGYGMGSMGPTPHLPAFSFNPHHLY